MKKLHPKTVNVLYFIIFLAGCLLMFLGGLREITLLVGVGGIVVMVALAFRILFYRCPYCGKYLDRVEPDGYCPHCGKAL